VFEHPAVAHPAVAGETSKKYEKMKTNILLVLTQFEKRWLQRAPFTGKFGRSKLFLFVVNYLEKNSRTTNIQIPAGPTSLIGRRPCVLTSICVALKILAKWSICKNFPLKISQII